VASCYSSFFKNETILAQVKADKDAVAKDTEANLRAVDNALHTMNAGTHAIQLMLDKQVSLSLSLDLSLCRGLTHHRHPYHQQQEGVVRKLTDQLTGKLDRVELEDIQTQVRSIVTQPDPNAQLAKVPDCLLMNMKWTYQSSFLLRPALLLLEYMTMTVLQSYVRLSALSIVAVAMILTINNQNNCLTC
jgi:hypothetical protein